MIKAVIIDDEIRAQVTIGQFLIKYCTGISIVGKASGVQTGIALIEQERPELVFLDINMQDGTGFDLLDRVAFKDFATIFTTAYDEYAIRAFKVKAMDYLLKPINPLELTKSVENVTLAINAKKELDVLKSTILNFEVEKLGLPVKNKVELTSLDNIVRMESEANYTNVILSDGNKVLVAKTLKIFEELLNHKNFLRVHQSHLVNLSRVVSFDKKEMFMLLDNQEKIPVSRRHKSVVLGQLSLRFVH